MRGTDPKLADEVVMLGGHFDSWHTATGATDNAAGSVVMMEALRILKAIGARPRRTIRLALWDAEEGGHLGSTTYVLNHFADPKTMALKPEHGKLAGYFNLDNGTGKIRGVFLQGNEEVRPIFESWLKPFNGLGATALAVQRVGGTDHLDFDHVGLPAFQFVQDPIDYETAHASHQHGRGRINPGSRSAAGRRHRRDLRVSHGNARREAAARDAAEGAVDLAPTRIRRRRERPHRSGHLSDASQISASSIASETVNDRLSDDSAIDCRRCGAAEYISLTVLVTVSSK